MVAFWDTEGVNKGTYDSELFLRYGESSDQHNFKLEVKDDEINVIGTGYVISKEKGKGLFDNTLTVVLITVIAVLIIINILWFLVLRKRLAPKVKK